jgi:ribosomal protein S18 acetylase RimI-like enzyme
LLEWDSAFFGTTIARVLSPALDVTAAEGVDRWCRKRGVKCIYFLCKGDDPVSAAAAEGAGYQLVDIRVSLQKKLDLVFSPPPPTESSDGSLGVRPVQRSDLAILRELAGANHVHSRFFRDLHFPRDKAAELYSVWIEKCCTEGDDTVLVAEYEGQLAGYICFRCERDKRGLIVLAGVAKSARKKGVGSLLVREADAGFEQRGARDVSVVTQGSNIPAQRLYNSFGYFPVSVDLWFHKWYS